MEYKIEYLKTLLDVEETFCRLYNDGWEPEDIVENIKKIITYKNNGWRMGIADLDDFSIVQCGNKDEQPVLSIYLEDEAAKSNRPEIEHALNCLLKLEEGS